MDQKTGGLTQLTVPIRFGDIAGWREDDHCAALACFRISAGRMMARPHTTKAIGTDGAALANAGALALRLDRAAIADRRIARRFFEDRFAPHAVQPNSGTGFVTGYFEPQVDASPVRTARFAYPLLRRPADLVDLEDGAGPASLDPSFRFARRDGSRMVEFFDRAAIEAGALSGRGLELAWIESPVDGFFIHVQGSARLTMAGGETKRISYAGKSGHPFTSIGRVLIARGELARETVTMQSIRSWLAAHPSEAAGLMAQNRSYIFFKETDQPDTGLGPVAAASVPLTPGRSLAVDHTIHTFGTPVWVAIHAPLPGGQNVFRRLMIAQDTGSAIVGPARGDLFIGSGFDAGEIAGAIRHAADFILLRPLGGPGGPE